MPRLFIRLGALVRVRGDAPGFPRLFIRVGCRGCNCGEADDGVDGPILLIRVGALGFPRLFMRLKGVFAFVEGSEAIFFEEARAGETDRALEPRLDLVLLNSVVDPLRLGARILLDRSDLMLPERSESLTLAPFTIRLRPGAGDADRGGVLDRLS